MSNQYPRSPSTQKVTEINQQSPHPVIISSHQPSPEQELDSLSSIDEVNEEEEALKVEYLLVLDKQIYYQSDPKW